MSFTSFLPFTFLSCFLHPSFLYHSFLLPAYFTTPLCPPYFLNPSLSSSLTTESITSTLFPLIPYLIHYLSPSLLSVPYRYAYSITPSSRLRSLLSAAHTPALTQSTRRSLWSGDKTSSKPAASSLNPLTPNDLYMSRTAPLTSKRCILYIYSINIGTEYFKHALYSPLFSLQMQFFFFIMLTCLVPVLFTFYIQDVLK